MAWNTLGAPPKLPKGVAQALAGDAAAEEVGHLGDARLRRHVLRRDDAELEQRAPDLVGVEGDGAAHALRGGDDVKFKAAGMKHYRAGKVGWLLEDGTHKVTTIDGDELYLPPSDLIKLTMPQLGPKRPPDFSSVKQYRAAGRAAVTEW